MKTLLYLLALLVTSESLHSFQPPRQLPAVPPLSKSPAASQPIIKPQVPLQPQPPITAYQAAGILPFGVDSQGNVHLLVGIERRSFKNGPVQSYAMDFGGKIDPQDKNNSAFSAAREGAEELTFIYDETPADFQRLLDIRKKFGKNFNLNACGSKTYKRILAKIQKDEVTQKPALYINNNNFYVMYFPRFSYRDVDQLFQKRIKQYGAQIPYDWHEKSKLVWLPVADVIKAIKAKPNLQAPLVVNGITLWPYFASSVEQAYQRGILENLR